QVTVYATNAGEVEAIWNRRKLLLPPGDETINGVRVVRLPLKHLPLSPYGYYLFRRIAVLLSRFPSVPESLLRAMSRYTPWVPELAAALERHEGPIDLVHAFTIPFESLISAAVSFAQARSIPTIITPFLHTGEALDPHVSRSYAMSHQVALMKEAHQVTAMTEVERRFLVRAGLREDRVQVVGAGIRLDGVSAEVREDRAPVTGQLHRHLVLFLGAATYDKGAVHLVQAMGLLAERGIDAHLVIAGTAVDHFHRFFDSLPADVKARCHLAGRVSEEEKGGLLAACDILAMPSRVDSFGLVYLEAWGHKKPVIGARAGGVPEVISNEEDGLLVEFGDVPALADAVESLLKDEEKRIRLGLRGYEKLMTHYTWDKVYCKMWDVYKRALEV
ncbi:MAG: glycosyl transferase group 1, partial [Dehalococcoidia bacterium]|nr:glycosyl transferase group 1 [Dehalococcoidia bacterium]